MELFEHFPAQFIAFIYFYNFNSNYKTHRKIVKAGFLNSFDVSEVLG